MQANPLGVTPDRLDNAMVEEAYQRVQEAEAEFGHPISNYRIIRIAQQVARDHYGQRLASRLLDPIGDETET